MILNSKLNLELTNTRGSYDYTTYCHPSQFLLITYEKNFIVNLRGNLHQKYFAAISDLCMLDKCR